MLKDEQTPTVIFPGLPIYEKPQHVFKIYYAWEKMFVLTVTNDILWGVAFLIVIRWWKVYYWIYLGSGFFHGVRRNNHILHFYMETYILVYSNIIILDQRWNIIISTYIHYSQEENFNNFVLIQPLTQMDLAEHPRYFLLVIAKLWPKNLGRRIIRLGRRCRSDNKNYRDWSEYHLPAEIVQLHETAHIMSSRILLL